MLFVATMPSSTSKADWSALFERPVVSKLCGAMLLPCAASCPSVVARAAAVARGRRQCAAVQLRSQLTRSDWMAAALLPDAAVFTARSATCA